tara:strand:+ start:181 stop:498 length:318 start_codon:yes stop_codon:yes gene_type:complete
VDSLIASDKSSFELRLDESVYSIAVIKKASYALMQLMSCLISNHDGKVTVKVTPTPDCDKGHNELEALLVDELLDYSLREIISDKTEPVRNLILSNAFSNTKLVG